MLQFAQISLLSYSFIPHGHCYLWKPSLVSLHVISDALIALAYYSIPIMLVYFVRRRRDVPFDWIFGMFGLFIIACGTTHLLEIWTLWYPTYWLSGGIKAITALASIGTAISLIPLLPKAFALPSPAQLEAANVALAKEITERRQAERDILVLNTELEQRVEERTSALKESNQHLLNEIVERQRVEDELRRSLKELSDIKFALDKAAIVVATDPQGTITDVNEKFCELSQYSGSELIGQNHRIVNSGYHPTSFFQNLWQTITGGNVWHGEICNRAKDGGYYWVDTTIVPFLNDQGKPFRYLAIRFDITERKQAEADLKESEERWQLALRGNHDGIWDWNLKTGQVFLSARWKDMLGYTDAELPNHFEEWNKRIHPHDRDWVLQATQDHLSGKTPYYSCEYRLLAKDNTYKWVLSRGQALWDETGQPIRLTGSHTDITDRKLAEQQIRDLNQDLERRVQERTQQLMAANRELEAFSYSVSHDLRSPLRSIDGFSQALLERHADQLDERGKHYLQRVRAASQRMGQLIDDMLQLSRVTRSTMAWKPVDLSAIAQTIASELQQTQPERDVTFAIVPGLTTQGDPHLLTIVLDNLLNNAWKFTSHHAQAKIEFGAIASPEQPITYFVRDDGAGFDMTYAHKLFGAFQRLHAMTEFPGNGVGLATIQRVIHRHGGKIWAEAAVEQGATFYFTIAQALELPNSPN